MLKKIEEIPYVFLILVCVTLGLAPFVPEPHVLEKLRMLSQGELYRPIDIFDLLLHGTPWLLLLIKIALKLRGGDPAE